MNFSDNTVQIDPTLLDNLQSHLAVINPEGDIIKTNKAWDNFGNDQRPPIDNNYFHSLQKEIEFGNDYALKLLLGLKQVTEGKKESFSITYPADHRESKIWFKASILPCEDSQHCIVIHEDVSSAEQLKKDQKKRDNRYRAQFEHNMLGILITDTNGNIVDANPAACDLLGYNHKEIVNFRKSQVMDVENPAYQKALSEKEEAYYLETHLIHRDGSKIPVEISSRTYRTSNGKLRTIVSFRDISRRKSAEEQLKNNKHFTDSALNSIPGVFIVLDSNYNIIRWNDNLLEQLEYTEDQLSEKNALDFIVEEEKQRIIAKMKKAMEGEELSIETKVVSDCGKVRDYYIFAKPFEENGNKFLVGTGIDITENKKTERENRKNQKMLQQLFDNSPNGIVIADTEDRIQQVNKSFLRIFDYTEEELIGSNVNRMIIPDNKKAEAEAISLATKSGQMLKVETVRKAKDGREVPVLIGSVPVTRNGDNIAIYGIYTDITDQHNYQEKIKHTLHEKEILLSELHHRVKNNLALINSLLELQCFETENEELATEIEKIKGRILTIASIHEALFQNSNLTNIPFDNYLEDFFRTDFISDQAVKNNIRLNAKPGNCYLNINQSIPSGLFLTELLSLIFKFNDTDTETNIDVQLREYSGNMHLIVEGRNLLNCTKEVQQDDSLHRILVNTLVKQINGTLIWPSAEKGTHQKFELIFKKIDGQNPAHHLLNKN